MDMRWLLFDKEDIEVVKKFGRETGWIGLRWRERRRWSKKRRKEWGRDCVRKNRGLVRERKDEKRERDLRLGRERMRRRHEKKKEDLLKNKGGGVVVGAGREHPLQVFHLWRSIWVEGGRC